MVRSFGGQSFGGRLVVVWWLFGGRLVVGRLVGLVARSLGGAVGRWVVCRSFVRRSFGRHSKENVCRKDV